MDDYITKPVRPETIAAALERWIRRPGPERDTVGPADTPTADGASEPLDRSQIELLRSLDDGDGAVFGEIIDQYLTQTAEGREELGRSYARVMRTLWNAPRTPSKVPVPTLVRPG
jgi:DNA-binding response OmpR family regulator